MGGCGGKCVRWEGVEEVCEMGGVRGKCVRWEGVEGSARDGRV